MGMEEQSSYDYSKLHGIRVWTASNFFLVLTAEYASLVALEFNRNPVINDEADFDIYPPYVCASSSHSHPLINTRRTPVHQQPIATACRLDLQL